MLKIAIATISLLLIISCSLDRNNPLDPFYSGIQAPGKVTGINISITEEYTIEIQWEPMNPDFIDGYFIYRSQTYDGLYSIIFEPDEHVRIERLNVIEFPGQYSADGSSPFCKLLLLG